MSRQKRQSNYLNGVPELLILRLLSEREMYGYELVQAIYDSSGKSLEFAEGVIYPLLHSLEREGVLKTRGRNVDGRRRVYYSLTRSGAKRLDQATAGWAKVVSAVESVLGGRARAPETA